MEFLLFVLGVFAGGAIMYYIQPAIKDMVTQAFASVPTIIAKAEALKQRANDLLAAAKDKQAAAKDASKGNPGA